MSLVLKNVGTRFVYRLVEDTLFDMTFLDDELSSLVYSSSQAVILILKLWQYEPNISDEASDYWNGCLGEQTFGDVILSSKRRLSTFLDALLFKLRRLGDLVELVVQKGGLLHEHVELLTVSFIKVQRRVTSLREKQSLCLHELAVITSLLAPPLTPKDWFLDNSALILRTAPFPSCNWKGEAQIHQGKHILALLASSACYPRVLKAISDVTLSLLAKVGLQTKLNPWYYLASYVEENLSILPTVTLDILTCDNSSCLRSPDESRPLVKACSGCRFVTYCSVACQKSDWELKHRFECVELKHRSQGHYNAIRMSQRGKAFHLTLATQMVNDPEFQESCDQGRGTHYPTHHANELVITRDMTYADFPKKILGIQTWDEWLENRYISMCSAMELRLASLVRETRPATRRGDVQGNNILALELILDWNDEQMLSLLVWFEDVGRQLLRPKRSVWRVVISGGKGATDLENVQWLPS
ncbi:hypothetical protein BKA70DRAFT_1493968 [Coprinopsis sp. MPI-PUGE-AT-0042]|nr:hypothetical protein BKA70DRAFT_1493968 [Coprinopsis sp. MPI-PUGE-AT-0042]